MYVRMQISYPVVTMQSNEVVDRVPSKTSGVRTWTDNVGRKALRWWCDAEQKRVCALRWQNLTYVLWSTDAVKMRYEAPPAEW